MAMRGPCPVLLLTFILLAASLALTSGQSCVQKNRIFQKQHVDYPRVSLPLDPYWNRIMSSRQIYGKQLNTFIHAPIATIKNICSGGRIPSTESPNMSVRKTNFSTITCRYNQRSRSYTGSLAFQKIVICCCSGLAVDYKE